MVLRVSLYRHRQMVRLLCHVRQQLAQFDVRGRGCDRFEFASVIAGSLGFHVPQIDMRRPACEPDQNHRFGATTHASCGQRG